MKRQSFIPILLVVFSFLSLSMFGQVAEPHIESDTEEIFETVEEMPMFPGCDNIRNPQARKQCADQKMVEYLYKNLKYPAEARKYGVEGMQVVSFVVDKSGEIRDIKIKKGIGFGGDKSAMDLMTKMQEEVNWVPGKQRGKAVSVQFTLPLRYKLEHPSDNYIQSDEFLEVYAGKYLYDGVEISAAKYQTLKFSYIDVDLVETPERALKQYDVIAPNGLIVVQKR